MAKPPGEMLETPGRGVSNLPNPDVSSLCRDAAQPQDERNLGLDDMEQRVVRPLDSVAEGESRF
jgi:hypothetical protein